MNLETTLSQGARKELTELYPYLLPRNAFTGQVHKDYDYSYVVGEHDLPPGWFKLFLQCCEHLKSTLVEYGKLHSFYFTQVKEKYGLLRMYTSGGNKEVYDILDKYSFLSNQVCCECGKPAKYQSTGYVCPYCSDCVSKSGEPLDKHLPIIPHTKYATTIRNNGVEEEVLISVEKEWNTYMERLNDNEV